MPLFGQPFEEYENVWQTLDRHHSVQWKQHENNLFVSQGDFEHLMTAGTLAHLQWKTWIHLSYKVFPWGPTKTQKHQEVNRNLCCTNSLSAAHMSEFNCQRICNAAKYTIHLWPVDIFSTLLMTSFMLLDTSILTLFIQSLTVVHDWSFQPGEDVIRWRPTFTGCFDP